MTVYPRTIGAAPTPSTAGFAGDRQPVEQRPALVTWTAASDAGCPTLLAGQRCIYPRWHPGSCGLLTASDTGLTFAVTFGQAGSSGAPNVATDEVGVWDRACEIAARLEQQLAAIADVHAPHDYGVGEDHHGQLCRECAVEWPCPTARLLQPDYDADLLVEITEGEPF